jgi:hypothetical protein
MRLALAAPVVLDTLDITDIRGTDDLSDVFTATCALMSADGHSVDYQDIRVTDGDCFGVAVVNARLTRAPMTIASGLTNLKTAANTAVGRGAKLAAIKTFLVTQNLVPQGV